MNHDLKTTQAELLSMMKEIDAFCCKYDIAYSLTGGSLLGAIRHNGFIPWDDDIDIMVDRENYNKILRYIDESAQYRIGRGNWLQFFEKRDGSMEAHIDIFIMDHLPENACIAKAKLFMLKILQGMLKKTPSTGTFSAGYRLLLFITSMMGKLFTRKFLLKVFDRVSQIGNKKPSSCIHLSNDGFRQLKYKHSARMMEKMTRHDFEDAQLSITAMYHEYLSNRYGDYMTPPPREEQVPEHSCKA